MKQPFVQEKYPVFVAGVDAGESRSRRVAGVGGTFKVRMADDARGSASASPTWGGVSGRLSGGAD
ncbi:MAG: hypothetical protein M0T84_01360 [Betaproteobacteria bacterium]|nr:hypothetical protein [Betaproteobacteria bacterium]